MMILTTANDSVTLGEGPAYKVNSGSVTGWSNGLLIDGAGGTDTVFVHENSTRTSYFTYSLSDDGIVSFTSASGSSSKTIQFTNFDSIEFWDKKLTLGTIGNDALTGTPFADNIYGFKGNDTIDGGAGADVMVGGSGNDTYTVDNAGDLLTELKGGGRDKVLTAMSYTLKSNFEDLTLTGSAAVNGSGNTAANAIMGNSAANVLWGGLGKDKLTGGGGADTFDFNSIKESTPGLKHDVITDFAQGTDKIDLSGIDAISGGGNDVFTFLTGANTAFGGHAGELHFLSGVGKTIIEGDVTGDGVADFQIELKGSVALVETDFIL